MKKLRQILSEHRCQYYIWPVCTYTLVSVVLLILLTGFGLGFGLGVYAR